MRTALTTVNPGTSRSSTKAASRLNDKSRSGVTEPKQKHKESIDATSEELAALFELHNRDDNEFASVPSLSESGVASNATDAGASDAQTSSYHGIGQAPFPTEVAQVLMGL